MFTAAAWGSASPTTRSAASFPRAGGTTLGPRASAAPQHRTVERQHNAVAVPDPSEAKRLEGPPRDAWSFSVSRSERACARTSKTIVAHAEICPCVASFRALRHVEKLEKSPRGERSCESWLVLEYSAIDRGLFVDECNQFPSAALRAREKEWTARTCVIKTTNSQREVILCRIWDLISEYWISEFN